MAQVADTEAGEDAGDTVKIKILERAVALREGCMAEMSRCAEEEPDMDPGDAHVDLKGNPHNVLAVLAILDAIGVPGCRAR